MKLLSPGSLWLAGLAIPIIVLYLLRVKRKQVLVPSVLLWEKLLQEKWVDTPWQRLKRNLLLFLQLLILSALVLALARPALAEPNLTRGSVILLLDASASMRATDVRPSRFKAAQAEAIAILKSLDRDAHVGVVLVGPEPAFLVPITDDRLFAQTAISAAAPTSGEADWNTALSLAAGASKSLAANVSTVIISDGGITVDRQPLLPGQVRYISIGSEANNLAITGLSSRRTHSGSELFIGVTNYGSQSMEGILAIERDGALMAAQQLELGPGETTDIIEEDLPGGSGLFQVRLEPATTGFGALDDFNLDNQAAIWHAVETGNRILLGTRGNYFLEALVDAMSGFVVTQVLPDDSDQLTVSDDDFDILILDGLALPGELSTNLLWLNPMENTLFPVGTPFNPTMGNAVVHPDPRTQFLSWNNISVLTAKSITLPDWAETLVESEGQPLVFAGETDGRRIAVLTFDIRDSDLPLQIDFPILIANLLDFLGRPSTAFPTGFASAGEPLLLPSTAEAKIVSIRAPSGEALPFSPVENDQVRFTPQELGLHQVEIRQVDGSLQALPIAVNLISDEESDIASRNALSIAGQTITDSEGVEIGYRELTGALIWFALILMLMEWVVYHRAGLARRWPPSSNLKFHRALRFWGRGRDGRQAGP